MDERTNGAGEMKSGTMNGGGWIKPYKRLAIYIRDSFTCGYCGRDLRNAAPNELTIDHLVPRSAGGTNDADNLTLACLHCNSSRQDKPWMDYAPGGAVERIETRRHQPLNYELAKAIIAGTAGDPRTEAER